LVSLVAAEPRLSHLSCPTRPDRRRQV
jgi:hypothetical protein